VSTPEDDSLRRRLNQVYDDLLTDFKRRERMKMVKFFVALLFWGVVIGGGLWWAWPYLERAQLARVSQPAPRSVPTAGQGNRILAQIFGSSTDSSQVAIPAGDLKQLAAVLTAVQITVNAMQGEIQRQGREAAKQADLTALREQVAASDRKLAQLFELSEIMVELLKRQPTQPAVPAAPAPKRDVDVVPPTAQPNTATEKMVTDSRLALQREITGLQSQLGEIQKKLGPLEKIEKLEQRLAGLERNDRRLEKLDKLDKFDPTELKKLGQADLSALKEHNEKMLEHLAAIQQALLYIAKFLAGESQE
jgi:hypothetical protein